MLKGVDTFMKFSKQEKSWIMYDWANSAYSMAITSVILPIFFKSVAAAQMTDTQSTALWGYANTFEAILVAMLAPILGTIADYKGYKKKFFTFFFIIGVVFTFSLVLVNEGNWLLCLVLYVLTAIGFSGANIFYDSFLTDVTSNERMDAVSTYGYGYGYIGSTIPFIISIVFILKPEMFGISSLTATRLAFIITAIWWSIFTLPLIKNVKQTYFIEKEPKPLANSFKRLGITFQNIQKYKTVWVFLIAYFFYIDGVSTIIKMATSYGIDIGIGQSTLIIVLLWVQIVAFPFAILFGKFAKKLSGKKMIFIGIMVYITVTILASFMYAEWHFWVIATLVGMAQGGIQALSRSYFGKIIPKDRSNEFFGFYNIFGKFAAIIGPSLVGTFGLLFNDSRKGILSLLILFGVGAIMLLRVPEETIVV